jgi:hypothetical protein
MIRALRDGKTAEEILDSWDTLLPGYMKEWGLERVQVGGAPRASPRSHKKHASFRLF